MSNQRNVEARTLGTENSTIMFLTKNHLVAMLIFIIAIISANLWSETIIIGVTKAFNVKKEDIGFSKWVLVALSFSFMAYFIIVHIFKVPITAAFGL